MDDEGIKDFYRNLPRLETPHLILRKATQSDASDIFAYSSDADVTQFLRWGPHQTLTDTQNHLDNVLAEYRDGRDGPWMIELKQSNRVLGHIHLMEISAQHNKAQVGFVLAKDYWNKGIMTEALGAVLDYTFRVLALNRIEAWCVRENQAARRVLEKCGMTKEGESPEYLYQKGKYWDFCLYAILRNAFLGARGQSLN